MIRWVGRWVDRRGERASISVIGPRKIPICSSRKTATLEQFSTRFNLALVFRPDCCPGLRATHALVPYYTTLLYIH